MRPAHALFLACAVAAGLDMLDSAPAAAQCSVFDRHPCAPTVCSVFRRRPCIPEIDYPLGETLQLTILSTGPDVKAGAAPAETDPKTDGTTTVSEHKLDTIREMFAALRECWIPPPEDEARPGMQMSVRLSFKRTGEIIGVPRVTYASPDAPREARDLYHDAITAALTRCTPLPFTPGLGGALAGRPIAIRYVDNRNGH